MFSRKSREIDSTLEKVPFSVLENSVQTRDMEKHNHVQNTVNTPSKQKDPANTHVMAML